MNPGTTLLKLNSVLRLKTVEHVRSAGTVVSTVASSFVLSLPGFYRFFLLLIDRGRSLALCYTRRPLGPGRVRWSARGYCPPVQAVGLNLFYATRICYFTVSPAITFVMLSISRLNRLFRLFTLYLFILRSTSARCCSARWPGPGKWTLTARAPAGR